MTQMVTIVRGAASATKRGMVPFESGLISLAFIPNTPFFCMKKKNISHSVAMTCVNTKKGMIYSHKRGRKKDHAKVCNLLHLVKKKNCQKPYLMGGGERH